MDFPVHDYGTFEEFDDMEYLFDDGRMNYEDGFESSLSTNVPNTFNIEHFNSPAVDAILSAFLEPNQPAPSYNYIEELEDPAVHLPVTNELPVMFPEPLQSFDNPVDPAQFAHILPILPVDTTQSGNETRVINRQRTRRKEKVPRAQGPNRFGRAGCKRCELCRKHRQKCLYTEPDLPCERCKERGAPCGPKIWGEKTESALLQDVSGERSAGKAVLFLDRPISKPKDEVITPFDDFYLQYFLLEGANRRYCFVGNRLEWSVVPMCRISCLQSSDVFRSAALAWASFAMSKNSEQDTFQYLDRCYKRLRQAISGPVSVDVAYGVYLLTRISYHTCDPTHLVGLGKIIECLQVEPNGLFEWEFDCLFELYCRALRFHWRGLYDLSTDIILFTSHVRKVCDSIMNIFRDTRTASITAHWMHLEGVQAYYSIYYLLLLNGVLDDRSIGETSESSVISTELHRVTELFSHHLFRVPGFVDGMQRLEFQSYGDNFTIYYPHLQQIERYFRWIIFLRMLENCDRENPELQQYALRLYDFATCMARNGTAFNMAEVCALVLSGLVLTKSRHPEENAWITNQLETTSYYDSVLGPGPVQELPVFLDQADTCSSFHEILMLTVQNWSFWQIWLWLVKGDDWLLL